MTQVRRCGRTGSIQPVPSSPSFTSFTSASHTELISSRPCSTNKDESWHDVVVVVEAEHVEEEDEDAMADMAIGQMAGAR